MDARNGACTLFITLVVAGTLLILLVTDQTLLVLSAFVIYNAAIFLIGFALSPEAYPPRIPPRTHTAKTGLIPLGFVALNATVYLLLGIETLSYYVVLEYLAIAVWVTSVWLLGAFAARRHDSHRTRPEASYDVLLREYHKTENEPENPA